jgi:hypothetical protein
VCHSFRGPTAAATARVDRRLSSQTPAPLSIPTIRVLILRFIHNRRKKLAEVSPYFHKHKPTRVKTHLLLIPRRRTSSQDIILDTARRQMVKHGVIWHKQHTAVILHGRHAIQDALAQEHGQRRRRGQVAGRRIRACKLGRSFWRIQIDQVAGNRGMISLRRRRSHLWLGRLYDWRLDGLQFRRGWQRERREDAGRRGLLLHRNGFGLLGLVGRGGVRFGHIVVRDFQVVDQDVRVIYGCGQLVRGAHIVVDDELEVMSARRNVDNGREDILLLTWATRLKMQVSVVLVQGNHLKQGQMKREE